MSASPRLGRRRTLAILAAAAGLPLPGAGATAVPTWEWQGDALGAAARIRLAHPDRTAARILIEGCVAELRRLEAAFSLYRTGSEISRLNLEGTLDAPSADFVALMRAAQAWGERTGGAFDVTVQPLWRLHADHFARHPGDRRGPPAAALDAARTVVDFRAISITPRRIAFARPGMAITLNGIAQGFITDRVADRLRDGGIGSTLVEMGEIAAVGTRSDGAPWSVGVPARDGTLVATLALRDRAAATSAGHATPFEPTGRFHHLFDPRTGTSANAVAGVSVVAERATTADALSTALFVTPLSEAPALLQRACDASTGVDALVQCGDARVVHLTAGRSAGALPFIPPTKGDKR
ncbi:MAG: FAD:protein FMN transferase [Alphaproteobacteria bacterium]|nr:FAD:protein FMN transferase [Alphaproteobacteria bacterium]